MQIGFRHHHNVKSSPKRLSRGQRMLTNFVDSIIYIMATVGALVFVPQMWDVWTKQDISAVSLLSWGGMLFGNIFWIFYGVVHKAKPIIYASVLGAIIQLLIILGILMHYR